MVKTSQWHKAREGGSEGRRDINEIYSYVREEWRKVVGRGELREVVWEWVLIMYMSVRG